VERLVYSVGIPAVEAVQENEQLLMRVSETLSAPLEKLDRTAEKLVRELKEANTERRKLIRELAARESTVTGAKTQAEKAIETGGIRLVIRDFQDSIDIDRMVQTANALISKDDKVVTLFYGTDGKNARIMVMAGKKAIQKGVNASEIVREASTIVGGGGGGKPNFAQGGGTQIERLREAIQKAQESLREQLEH
jgi:alanyl-tRNA synthetase